MGEYKDKLRATAGSRLSELRTNPIGDAANVTPPASPREEFDQTPVCHTQLTPRSSQLIGASPRSSQLIGEVVDMWREATTPQKEALASASSHRELAAEDEFIDAISDETLLALVNQQELSPTGSQTSEAPPPTHEKGDDPTSVVPQMPLPRGGELSRSPPSGQHTTGVQSSPHSTPLPPDEHHPQLRSIDPNVTPQPRTIDPNLTPQPRTIDPNVTPKRKRKVSDEDTTEHEKKNVKKEKKKKKKTKTRDTRAIVKHLRDNQSTICCQLQDIDVKVERMYTTLAKVNISEEITRIAEFVAQQQQQQLQHQQRQKQSQQKPATTNNDSEILTLRDELAKSRDVIRSLESRESEFDILASKRANEVNEAKLQVYTTEKKLQEQLTVNEQLREQLEQKNDALLSYETDQKQQQQQLNQQQQQIQQQQQQLQQLKQQIQKQQQQQQQQKQQQNSQPQPLNENKSNADDPQQKKPITPNERNTNNRNNETDHRNNRLSNRSNTLNDRSYNRHQAPNRRVGDVDGRDSIDRHDPPQHTRDNGWTRVGRNRNREGRNGRAGQNDRARRKESDVVLVHDSLGHNITEGIMSREGLTTNKVLSYTLEEVSNFVTCLEYEPKALVVHSGTNNIKQGDSVSTMVEKYARIFSAIERRLPNTAIIYSAIAPREDDERKQRMVEQVNDAVWSEFGRDIIYVSNYDIWGDDYKRPDGVHLTKRGTSMLARNIKDGITPAVLR